MEMTRLHTAVLRRYLATKTKELKSLFQQKNIGTVYI